MTSSFDPALLEKIANPDFAFFALHNSEPHGEFKAFVRLAEPENHPSGMKVMEIHSNDLFKVRIRCDQIQHVVEDTNVLRIEFREFVSAG